MGTIASPYPAAAAGPAGGALTGSYPAPSPSAGNIGGGPAPLAAGAVPLAAPQVTASSGIYLTPQPGTAPLALPYISSKTPGTGFTITSLSALDASTVAWVIIG